MLVSKFEIREIKTTAKGHHQVNREILTLRNENLLQYVINCYFKIDEKTRNHHF